MHLFSGEIFFSLTMLNTSLIQAFLFKEAFSSAHFHDKKLCWVQQSKRNVNKILYDNDTEIYLACILPRNFCPQILVLLISFSGHDYVNLRIMTSQNRPKGFVRKTLASSVKYKLCWHITENTSLPRNGNALRMALTIPIP